MVKSHYSKLKFAKIGFAKPEQEQKGMVLTMKTIYQTAAKEWSLADNRGNHRVVVNVLEPGAYVRASINWRRRDLEPEKCAILAHRMKDDLAVNAKAIVINREYGEVVFEAPDAGEYALYYMPCKRKDDNWWAPMIDYAKEYFPSCDLEWEKSIPDIMPECKTVAIESRTEFDSFYPMEIPANAEETTNLLREIKDDPFVIFPEDRKFPVRMLYEFPCRWIEQGIKKEFCGKVRPDEYYVFQLAVYAQTDLKDIKITYDNFSGNLELTPSDITCYNREGTDWLGNDFTKTISCEKGTIQPLWFGLQFPADKKGEITFDVTVSAFGFSRTVSISLKAEGEPIKNHGDGELWRLSRLRWLNSSIGLSDEAANPYTPITEKNGVVSCLGRNVKFAENGLPADILSFFDESVHIVEKALSILSKPIEVSVQSEQGYLDFADFQTKTTAVSSGAYEFETSGNCNGLIMKNNTRMEYDGHLETFVTLTAQKEIALEDVSLLIAMTPECSAYMMGMGKAGGKSPESWEYEWNENYANNFIWIGGVNGGLHLKLKHNQEVWEIYNYQKIGLPESWANKGKGGCSIKFDEHGAQLSVYTGARRLKAGESITFRYSLQITPLKEIDSDAHWHDRYDHPGDKGINLQSAKEGGATVVNLHQGQSENPYINYPFCRDEILKPTIQKAHEMGMKYKLYYTVRELTTHAQEFFAVRSLANEVLLDGPTFRIAEHFKEGFFEQESVTKYTGGPWLCEHLPEGYTPAWQTILPDGDYDCSVATVGLSRWHNYYLEGLLWTMRELDADGIYLDGVGYDRQIMKRVRKVLDMSKDDCLIDFHSGNNFHREYGLCNVIGQYMELFPSVDSLWIGEGFDYEATDFDYWFVEISGIPFGLMGDMLHRGGNKWRGMVFGMTPRCNWPQGGSPLPIWQLWDKFGMKGCVMQGWWDKSCPVQTSDSSYKATAYVQDDRMLIAVASWAEKVGEVQLSFNLPSDWDRENIVFTIPEIENFQQSEEYSPDKPLQLEPAKGKIIIVEKKG